MGGERILSSRWPLQACAVSDASELPLQPPLPVLLLKPSSHVKAAEKVMTVWGRLEDHSR